jgi:hypothetical protein
LLLRMHVSFSDGVIFHCDYYKRCLF